MKRTLKQLIAGIPNLEVSGRDTLPVTAIATDSRRVVPGALFVALPGTRTDGHFFIDEAVDRGAVAVVCGRDCWTPPQLAVVRTEHLRAVTAELAARFYGHPQQSLRLTGFLGTSGKTVSSLLYRSFLDGEEPTGLIGTLHYGIGPRTLPAYRTTPEPVELQGLLAQMRDQGCRRVLLEVSSHGIDQGRVEGLAFENLVLLNLTPEHLDYHGSFEHYVALHRAFLEQQAGSLVRLVLGIDDPATRSLWEGLPAGLQERCLTFGQSPDASVRAVNIHYSLKETRFQLEYPEGQRPVASPLIGAFNLQDTLAALACGWGEGLAVDGMLERLGRFPGARGRMERVEAGQDFTVLIDYLHTPAAYAKALDLLRPLVPGRLITVFGCEGNRDSATRPVLARLVAEKSDQAIATADNPRNETVPAIFEEMRRGNGDLLQLEFIEDRRAAIARAVEVARPGDLVLLAGKGHETFQEYADSVVPFDDRAVLRETVRLNREEHGAF